MKKIIFSLAFLFVFGQAVLAQDIDKLITELTKVEGVEHQIIDRSMLDTAMAGAMQADSTGDAASNTPAFMKKVESIEVVAAEDVQAEVKDRFLTELNNFKDGNGYETLLTVKDEEDNVRILVQREDNVITAVIIFAIDDEDVAIVKMKGKFDDSDLTEIVNEQKKNIK